MTLMALSMAPFHLLGQDDEKGMQHAYGYSHSV